MNIELGRELQAQIDELEAELAYAKEKRREYASNGDNQMARMWNEEAQSVNALISMKEDKLIQMEAKL